MPDQRSLGGRSANRGQCAQACRLPYEMVVDGRPIDLGERAYLLSPQDLAAYDLVEPLAKAGVVSFKIEGRLKSAHYVAATTQTYRAAIDSASFALTPQGRRDLEQVFSRGLTHGFLDGVNHQALVQGRFPKSRGVRIGTVVRMTKRGVLVESISDDELVQPGDGIVFDLGKPETEEPGGRVYEVNPVSPRGERSELSGSSAYVAPLPARRNESNRIELTFARDFDLSVVPAGAIVWKTDDPVLRQRLERTFAGDIATCQRTPLTVRVRGAIGGALEITATDDAGRAGQRHLAGTIGGRSQTTADGRDCPRTTRPAQRHPVRARRCGNRIDRRPAGAAQRAQRFASAADRRFAVAARGGGPA